MNSHWSEKWIRRWQKTLKEGEYYLGNIDGQFGPKTLEASLVAAKLKYQPLVIERKGDTQLIMDECDKHGLTLTQKAYVLATVEWETARTFKPVKEAFWLSENWRKKNLRYYPWYGRGHVQLTWKQNYQRAEDELQVPFTKTPELAMDSVNSANICVVGMRDGWFTGHRLDDHINEDKTDYVGARYIVNGRDKRYAIASLARDFEEDLKIEQGEY
jgi:hypothetical protein